MELGEYEFHKNYGKDNWWHFGMRRILLQYITRHTTACHSVDLGCGPGFLVNDLSDLGYNASGVDIEASVINYANEVQKGNYFCDDLINFLDNSKSSFDLITLIDVLSHKKVNQTKLFDAIVDKLAINSTFIIRVPAFMFLYSNHDIYVHQLRRYKIKDFRFLTEYYKIKLIDYSYNNFFLFLPILIRLLISKKNKDVIKGNNFNPHKYINKLLISILNMENFLNKVGIKFPFGTTLTIVYKKY